MNDKRITPVANSKLHSEVPVQNDVNLPLANLQEEVQPLASYQNSSENEAGLSDDSGYTCDPSVFSALGELRMPYMGL
ncbi:hypothetical protein QQP08_020982 [Theobroma cacao]|nr:hypothetical protein QQP08_020982 [Theobroma cacao]